MLEENDKITPEQTKHLITDLGILLNECIDVCLDTNWGKKYQWDKVTSFECLVDEVDRVYRVIELHDHLATVSDDDICFALNGGCLEDLVLTYHNKEELVLLKERIDKELNDENRKW